MGLDTFDHRSGTGQVDLESNQFTPTPGSRKAQLIGCVCPVLDNYHGKGMQEKDGTHFWISGECHVHRCFDGVKGYKKVPVWNDDGSANRPNDIVRIYFCDDDGRPDKEPHNIESSRGANYVRNLIALGGENSIEEARAWGHKIKAVGHEEGVMTVHLGARWI